MFTSLLLALTLHVAPATPVTQCETYAPNLSGVRVTVCAGSVVAYTDASGYTVRPADWR